MTSPTSKPRSVASAGPAHRRPGTRDFSASNVSAEAVGRTLDPVIAIDHFHMRAPKFPPHPHAGFSAVTYLFEDSEGEFENHDSLGHQLTANPGALIWTVAGSGVMHEEFPRVRGQLAHGLQVFVNLAAAEKLQSPRILFVDGPDVPVFEREGVRVRVAAGTAGGTRAKVEPPGDITFLDIKLETGATFEQPVSPEHSALAYVIEGSVSTSGATLDTLEAASFAADGDTILLSGGAKGARVVLIAGRTLGERVVAHGPFVMNDEAQINAAIERFRTGRMGHLTSTAGF